MAPGHVSSQVLLNKATYTDEPSRQVRDDIRREIAQVRSKLALLEGLERHLASRSSPVNSLPFEILSEIFLLVSPSPIRDYDDREELLNLGLVCKLWRTVSISTKGLWSGVCIDFRDNEYERIAMWLARSGGLPKKVELIALPDPRDSGGEESHCPCVDPARAKECRARSTTFVRLLSEGPYLAHLTLNLEWTSCYRRFRNSLRRHCKNIGTLSPWDGLQSLDLRMLYPSFYPDEMTEELFEDLPNDNLKTLRLILPSIDTFDLEDDDPAHLSYGESPSLHIPTAILRKLKSFSIKYNWGSTHVLDAIQHCAEDLEVLKIDISPKTQELFADWSEMRDFMRTLSEKPISFKKLHTLDIRNANPDDPDNCYLSCLRTPNLRHLTLVGRSSEVVYTTESEGDPISPYFVTTFLQQSAPESLLSMHLENIPHEDARIQYFIDHQPLLQSVTLSGTWSLKTYGKMWRNFRAMKEFKLLDVDIASPLLPEILRTDWAGLREERNVPPCELLISVHVEPLREVLTRACQRLGRAKVEAGNLLLRV